MLDLEFKLIFSGKAKPVNKTPQQPQGRKHNDIQSNGTQNDGTVWYSTVRYSMVHLV
jgi:hypothetical protein